MEDKLDHKTVIKEELKQIEISDGVSKKEAIIIAQNELIKDGLEKEYYISKPIITESKLVDGCWFVRFNMKFKFGYILEKILFLGRWCGYHIEKKSGEIKMKDWGPDL
ncbi:MAG: hypothetical protein V1674_05095 [Candidatus Omnitrophota bacterium]